MKSIIALFKNACNDAIPKSENSLANEKSIKTVDAEYVCVHQLY